jgi:hypothetical protein
MCMSRVAKHDFSKLLWNDNGILNKLSKIHVLLVNIHQHLAVVFTSLEQFVRRQTVK